MNQDPDVATFFEHGRVELLERDYKGRQAAVKLIVPNCIFQTVSPSVLAYGHIDNFNVYKPFAVWLPKLTAARFVPQLRDEPHIAEKTNVFLQQQLSIIMREWTNVAQLLMDPNDILAAIPYGTYVEMQYRFKLDSLGLMLLQLEAVSHLAGVADLRAAFAHVLTTALRDVEKFEETKRLLSAGK